MEPVGNLKRLQNKREAHSEALEKMKNTHYLSREPKYAFDEGQYVWKPKGYPFEGTVVSAFETLSGDLRYVVESKLSPGLLHIFNAKQLEKV